ncbi:tetratricopeptide repeat protein [Pyxidicoccus parkwayensis]|uniref:Tetratricopeptide repeat protein n=1 Tax=Pyxidicoccus parkwayensis TaxID=2813578 RepID=A0ABX7NPX7_9BACT|nr:serine/threonine-protein kinase [Pyxidicoccus parkwaysis]QSQ19504.1 tetratricopeptide repeat protein [Pyxidicoccus parkwaysis]
MDCPDRETWQAWRLGMLPPETQRALASHREGCARCQALGQAPGTSTADDVSASAGSMSRPASRPLMRGTSVGRYVVLAPVGSGGMGVVYAAYDPKLDRKVALKLVRTDGDMPGAARQQRLLQEAQALARLSHPNVVSVHDAGSYLSDQVFLAMEFVDGGTLRDWLKDGPRSWRDTVQVFLQAGRGLAAAHAAGLVHRDFKPDNVLLGRDGRARVTDFGLALLHTEMERAGAEGIPVVGTRGYQAPEVLAGRPADARADQFSFCVALYEALHGRRPFDGGFDGVPALPRDLRVPARVRRVLRRGLSLEPGERYSSLDGLLQELTRSTGATHARRLGLTGVALAVLIIVGLFPYRRWRESRACAEAASLAGLWDDARREAASHAFTALERPFAADAWKRAEPLLEAYANAWAAQTRDNCEATHVRATQPEEEYRQRGTCLERRRDELRALGDLLAQTDDEVAGKVVQAVQSLSPVTQCGPGATPPSSTAEETRDTKMLWAQVARARVLRAAGRYAQGMALAKDAAERATPGSSLQAEALLWLGVLQDLAGDSRAAEKSLDDALLAAERSRQRELEAWAWIHQVNTVGVNQGRIEDGRRSARHADAVLDSLGRPPRLEIALSMAQGQLAWREGKPVEALQHLERTLALQEKELGPDDVDQARTLAMIAVVQLGQTRLAEARATSQRALELREKVLGPEHPEVAASLHVLGAIVRQMDELPTAFELTQRALTLRERALGPEHPEVAASANNLAIILTELGRLEESRPLLLRTLSIRERVQGPEHPETGTALNGLGVLAFLQHDNQEALRYFQRSLAIKEKSLGKEHLSVAFAVCNIAIVLHRLGREQEALAWHQRALEVRLKAFGERHDDVAYSLAERGEVYRALGRLSEAWDDYARALRIYRELGREKVSTVAAPLRGMAEVHLTRGHGAEAVALFEEALKLLESIPATAQDIAEARFALARGRYATGRHAEALAEAHRARTELETAGESARHSLEEVRAWLSRHERRPTATTRPERQTRR